MAVNIPGENYLADNWLYEFVAQVDPEDEQIGNHLGSNTQALKRH